MAVRKTGQKITLETKRKIINAYNEEFRAAGFPTFEDVPDTIEDTVQNIASISPEKALQIGALLAIRKTLDASFEPSPKELKDNLDAMRGKLRYELRQVLSKSFERIKKQLPRKPGPGRGKALDPVEESAACDSVAAFIRQKVPYPVILKRVGQKFGVSDRTIQRSWQRRAKLKAES